MANASPNQPIVQAGAGTTPIVAGIAGQVYRVMAIFGSISANGTVKFQSSGGVKVMTGAMNLNAGVPFSAGPVSIENGEGFFETLPGEGFSVVSTGGAFNGFVSGQYLPG